MSDVQYRPGLANLPQQPRSIWDKLGETWPAKLAKSLYGAATLPGDVYAGRVDPNSDEGLDRAADLAGMMTGVGGTGSPSGALRAGFKLDYFGTPVQIMEDLSPQQMAGFLSRTKYKAARRIVDPDTGKIYAWDAADPALHKLVAEKLGIRFDPQRADVIGLD